MALFWFIIIVIILVVMVKVVTHESDEEQQAKIEKTNKELLENAQVMLAMTEAATQAKELGRDDVYDAIMANTYDGPLPEKRSDGAWTSIFDEMRILSIAGINHRKNINLYKGRNLVALVPEPQNEFDPNAIKVVAEDGHHLGYIRMDQTDMVRAWARDKFPFHCVAMITEHQDDDDGHQFFTGYLYIIKAEGQS